MQGLTQYLRAQPPIKKFCDEVWAGGVAAPHSGGIGLMRAARPYLVAALAAQLQKPILYLVASVDASRTAQDALRNLLGDDKAVFRLAEPNTSFYDEVKPVAEVVAQRSRVLAALARAHDAPATQVIVSGPRALMQPTLHPRSYKLLARVIKRDQELELEKLISHWVSIGYEPASVVERVGAFSRRGGILDVWSPATDLPTRIELFGDQVDSIRYFDPGTQRSGAQTDTLDIAPLEVLSAAGGLTARSAQTYSTLADYLGAGGLLVIDDENEVAAAWEELEAKAQREREIVLINGKAPDALPYVSWGEFLPSHRAEVSQTRALILGSAENVAAAHPISQSFEPGQHFAGQLAPFLKHLETQTGTTVVVSRQAARLAEMWSDRHSAIAAQTNLDEPPAHGLTFVTGALPGGWELTSNQQPATSNQFTLITDAEIFGYMRPEPSSYTRARRAAPEKAFADWSPGDAVVHEDYGVGIYRGAQKLTVEDHEREYLMLEFADADRLYVPIHQLDRISRYVGGDDMQPKLSKLGTQEWAQARTKAKGNAAEMAREMLRLYAERELAQGHAFGKDTPWQAELEASFPFVETDDQLSAIRETKKDMEQPTPMDRLICGDVGFGKTEVALRAAFKAVQDGTQVAVLVPTTVLAQQHWNTFSRRLAMYPIKVEMLSRFRTPAEKRAVLEGLREGKVDIVIGTHGVVAESVQFKNLGLAIIDEEHRFGIKQKEKLKKLRSSVDVLTLTATPIPRTLYLGLSGVRDISRIETPPAERLPIISHVGAFDNGLVQQAILRELDRDGQVFFIHNRISTIYLLEEKLKRLVPEATIEVAHGQMDERNLARVMSRFTEGALDILLCTNIVESGLDISNANTIIIDRADMFGLAELYQLRGRVGRSITQAYAYFLYDRKGHMTPEARERLETLREAAGMGAGYMVAMRDLELRGAGDMLGPKQSGHVASVGLELYTRLLAREVATVRAVRDGTPAPAPEPRPVTIDLPIATGLPENYIGSSENMDLRLQLYRRMASLDSEEKIKAFEEEIEDRFGVLPLPAKNLMFQMRLKLQAMALGATAITTDGNRFTVRADVIEKMNTRALEKLLGEGALIGRKQLSFVRSGTPEQWKNKLMRVVSEMANAVVKNARA
ncbi:MAG TPA: transcription-repair coupling factor [Thermoflexales bacterium]|nr:transcription-repair coupling factor [Thermoflexales bacterium]